MASAARSIESVQHGSRPRAKRWISFGLSAWAVLFLVFDAVSHLLVGPQVVEAFDQMGYPVSSSVTLGVIEAACLALYLFPRTSVLGAVLLTGYLGGAVASHLRIDSPLLS